MPRDRSPDSRRTSVGLHLPTRLGSGLSQTLAVAYSCGAVADFHRASRSSLQRIVILPSPLLLKLNSLLGGNALLKRMLDLPHLGYKIGNLNDFRFGIAPGKNHMKHGRLILKKLDNIRDRQKVVTERVVDFVQNHNVIISRKYFFLGRPPGISHHRLVHFHIFAFPGKTFPHRLNLESSQLWGAAKLAVFPFSFEKLEHDNFHTVAAGAERDS